MNFSARRYIVVMLIGLTTLLLSSCSSEQVTRDDFTLQSVDGPVSLSEYRNNIVLLFFGYTHCPDVCPATMNNVASALRTLDPVDTARVKVLFVTVDPERDSAEYLDRYLAYFNPEFIGLSGSAEEIKKAARVFEVEFFKEGERADNKYEVTHSSFLFLLDGDGKTVDIMSHRTKPDDIAIALRKWLNALPSDAVR
ncbi:SCO family protein [Mariprofundus micogutta]|nr:SCO family protein [Mariprofundus micogutta]